MQTEAPEAVSLDGETEATRRLYGLDDAKTKPYGARLLLARRLIKRRCASCRSTAAARRLNWDGHQKLADNHQNFCRETDKPIAGLLQDLKQRGLLKDTLVVWGSEFGRMPISQDNDGRDHNPHAFTMWLAGGGVKGGFTYGASDDLGYKAAENSLNIHDFHATLLHLLGLDHQALDFRARGPQLPSD